MAPAGRRGAGGSGAYQEKRIPGSYIIILQPTVTPYEMLSDVLRGYKPSFTYGTIFVGFAVDRVPLEKANEVRMDPRVLKVVENRVVSALSKELLIETLQTKYTVVNRDTGELYDVREIDGSMPYRYSVLPHNMKAPAKARRVLGINERATHVPPKAAKVMGHTSYRQVIRDQDGAVNAKAAQLLGVVPMSNSTQRPAPVTRRHSAGTASYSGRHSSRHVIDEEDAIEQRAASPAGPSSGAQGSSTVPPETASEASEDVLFDADSLNSPTHIKHRQRRPVPMQDRDDDAALPVALWRRHSGRQLS